LWYYCRLTTPYTSIVLMGRAHHIKEWGWGYQRCGCRVLLICSSTNIFWYSDILVCTDSLSQYNDLLQLFQHCFTCFELYVILQYLPQRWSIDLSIVNIRKSSWYMILSYIQVNIGILEIFFEINIFLILYNYFYVSPRIEWKCKNWTHEDILHYRLFLLLS